MILLVFHKLKKKVTYLVIVVTIMYHSAMIYSCSWHEYFTFIVTKQKNIDFLYVTGPLRTRVLRVGKMAIGGNLVTGEWW